MPAAPPEFAWTSPAPARLWRAGVLHNLLAGALNNCQGFWYRDQISAAASALLKRPTVSISPFQLYPAPLLHLPTQTGRGVEGAVAALLAAWTPFTYKMRFDPSNIPQTKSLWPGTCWPPIHPSRDALLTIQQ